MTCFKLHTQQELSIKPYFQRLYNENGDRLKGKNDPKRTENSMFLCFGYCLCACKCLGSDKTISLTEEGFAITKVLQMYQVLLIHLMGISMKSALNLVQIYLEVPTQQNHIYRMAILNFGYNNMLQNQKFLNFFLWLKLVNLQDMIKYRLDF